MVQEITLENLKTMAEDKGLKLAEDELKRLLPGVNRARKQAAELRQMIRLEDEPAGTFSVSQTDHK
jgi:hypothetical protein